MKMKKVKVTIGAVTNVPFVTASFFVIRSVDI